MAKVSCRARGHDPVRHACECASDGQQIRRGLALNALAGGRSPLLSNHLADIDCLCYRFPLSAGAHGGLKGRSGM
jgi:hypothetical protein